MALGALLVVTSHLIQSKLSCREIEAGRKDRSLAQNSPIKTEAESQNFSSAPQTTTKTHNKPLRRIHSVASLHWAGKS
ncbi:hypothetical protein BDP55DRAFT_686320 [Colletotrichum godetiae]|uniref:Uncharacterized protein n=1 Tax=Colletotrichum godetiae TaxID=1209918 RepID=A0AAJ0A8X3_9PEZI|nr:uncharacterized protein BDP55DRAFT_686320 [Colletotrichum godetiae]KAK1657221.1 hypothetical protein BDP55DRAFT_686320 [Colletotrichum godetiae]